MTKNNELKIGFRSTTALAQNCVASCRQVLARMNRAKEAFVSEFRDVLGARQQMLTQALNEAEALAWQTDFPHLFFPTLAQEKVEAVAHWHRRQRALQLRQPYRPPLPAN